MPQTPPFHSLTPDRKLSDTELARSIRLNVEAELDAINLYAAHIDASDNEEAKAILRHVMNEEKEHAALFYKLLRRLDGVQQEQEDAVDEKYRLIVSGASDEEVESVGKGGGGESGRAETPMVKNLTVGSMRRR